MSSMSFSFSSPSPPPLPSLDNHPPSMEPAAAAGGAADGSSQPPSTDPPPLLRCECGWVQPIGGHVCGNPDLSAHRVTAAASVVPDSDKRKPGGEGEKWRLKYCRGFAKQLAKKQLPPLPMEFLLALPLATLLRVSFKCGYWGRYFRTKGSRPGRKVKKPGFDCYLSAADVHSHAMRDALDLAALWAAIEPDVAAVLSYLDRAAVAEEKARGALRVLSAIGFPSTLLQHMVRFTLQRLHSNTVEWCRQLYEERRAAGAQLFVEPIFDKKKQPAEHTLCFWLAFLIEHEATLNCNDVELDHLADCLSQDGIFVQPHGMRNRSLSRFLLDTISLNRHLESQRNHIGFPQLFPPLTVSSASVATVEMEVVTPRTPQSPPHSPASPVHSHASSPPSVLGRRTSSELDSPLPLLPVLDGGDEFEQDSNTQDNEYENAPCKRQRTDLTGLGLDEPSPDQAQLAFAQCQDLTDDGASSLSMDESYCPPSPPSPLPPALAGPIESISPLTDLDPSFPGPSPSPHA